MWVENFLKKRFACALQFGKRSTHEAMLVRYAPTKAAKKNTSAFCTRSGLKYGTQPPPDPNAGYGDLAPISEVLGEVLCRYRRDHRGNVTVPGLRHESVNWRRVSKAFLQVSRETPTPYDALVDFAPGVPYVPRGFRVGGGVAFGVKRRVWMLRVAYTGEVMVVTTTTTSSASASDDTKRVVENRWTMRALVRSIGGQNANFSTRLYQLESVIAGEDVPLMANSVRVHVKKDRPSITHVNCGCSVGTSQLGEFNNQIYRGFDYIAFGVQRGPKQANGRYVYSKTSTLAFCKADTDHTRAYEHLVVAEPIASVDSKRVHGNLLVHSYRHARRDRGIHPLTIALGYYEAPDIAECGGWIVSLLNHGIENVKIFEDMDASNREGRLKFYAFEAKKRAEQREKAAVRSTALVLVHDEEGRESPLPLANGRPKRRQAYAAQTFIQAQTNMLNSLPRTYLLENDDGESSSSEEAKETSDEDSESGDGGEMSDSDEEEEEEEKEKPAAAAAEKARAEADIW